MAFDQDITYRVNIDDSNFQAKLTQMRASMDSSMGGAGMMGGMGGMGMMGGGFNAASMMAMMAAPSMNMGGGLADFGSQMRPVTYTPMAMSMQPHFGMYQIQQTLGQAGLASMGPFGAGLYAAGSAMSGFMRGGLRGAINAPNLVPENITAYEYFNESSRSFGNRMGDAAAVGTMTAANIGAAIPFGMAGSAIGSAMFGGAGLAAGAAGLLGGAAAAAIPAMYINAVGDSYKENIAIQEQLRAGSFRFISGNSPDVDRSRGRGFSMEAQRRVANSIQDMETQDLRYSMTEYRQVLESGMQNDMFSGTRDVKDFQDKFKGLIENVKTITSTLHTSLKEGVEVIRGFRDMGITDSGTVNSMVLRSEVMGRASGRTGMEMMAIGQQGAELFRGTGISMQRGFELNQMNVQAIRQGMEQGTLSRETVAQAGGELAFAQRQTASALSSFQTTIGRGMLMGAYNQATHSLDTGMLLQPGSAQNMMARAAGIGASGLMSLEARQEELISQLSPMQMRMFDINQSSMMAKTLVGGGYTRSFEDAFIYAGRMRGKSIEEIKADLSFMKQDPEEYKKSQQVAMEAVSKQAGFEDLRNRTGLGKAISNFFTGTFVNPVAQKLAGMREEVSKAVDNVSESFRGEATISAGLRSKEVHELANRLGGGDFGFVDASEGNTLWRRLIPGGQTTSAALKNFAEDGKISSENIEVPDENNPGRSKTINQQVVKTSTGQAFVFKNKEEAMAFQKKTGEGLVGIGETTIKDKDGKEQQVYLAQRASDMDAQSKAQRSLQITNEDRKNAEKIEVDKDALRSFRARALEAEEKGKAFGLEEAVRQLYGDKETYDKLKGADKAVVEKYLKAAGEFGEGGLKEMEKRSSTQTTTDTANLGREALSKMVDRSAIRVMEKLRSSEGGYSFKAEQLAMQLGGLDKGDMASVLTAESAEDRADVRARLSEKYGKERSKSIMDAMNNLSEEKKQALRGDAQNMMNAVKGIGTLTTAAQGSGADATASTLGNISKDTMVQIEQMSKQLIANYQILLEYQKQLEGKLLQNR
jgi:hypothetical protein